LPHGLSVEPELDEVAPVEAALPVEELPEPEPEQPATTSATPNAANLSRRRTIVWEVRRPICESTALLYALLKKAPTNEVGEGLWINSTAA
jgi:hypothetical protein